MSKQVVVIAGPSGSGESTITAALLERYPHRMRRLVTATTRPPRVGETNGIDYYFFSEEEFLKHVNEGAILESTYVENRHAYYGTYAPDLKKKITDGHIVLMNLDIIGARYYKDHYDATTIFIKPETIDALAARLRKRNPDISDMELSQRREQAETEMRDEPFYDYSVVNADGHLEEAIRQVIDILQKEGYNLS